MLVLIVFQKGYYTATRPKDNIFLGRSDYEIYNINDNVCRAASDFHKYALILFIVIYYRITGFNKKLNYLSFLWLWHLHYNN